MSQINSNIKDDFQVVLLLSCFVGHPVHARTVCVSLYPLSFLRTRPLLNGNLNEILNISVYMDSTKKGRPHFVNATTRRLRRLLCLLSYTNHYCKYRLKN